MDKVKNFITENHTIKETIGTSSFLPEDEGDKRYLMESEITFFFLVFKLSTDAKPMRLELEEY